MKKCPYCGCTKYYTKERISGDIEVEHSFNGDEVDNTSMYDGLIHKYKSKFIFCIECDKKIGKLEEVGLGLK